MGEEDNTMKKLGWVERRDKMEKIFPEILEALKLCKNWLDYTGWGNGEIALKQIVEDAITDGIDCIRK